MQEKIFPDDPAELSDFLKRLGMWNEETQAMYLDIMSNLENPQVYEEYKEILMPEVLPRINSFSPFNAADGSVDGRIRFASTEQGMPVGINPEECHVLIAGQTNSGKSTLLRIIFSQALLLNQKQRQEE